MYFFPFCAGYTESLDDDSEIVVPQDDYGLYAIDILDPSTVSFFFFLFFFVIFNLFMSNLHTKDLNFILCSV